MKAFLIFLFSFGSLSAAEPELRMVSIAQTNTMNATVYTKEIFTRHGQTNLIRITRIKAGGATRIYHFYHDLSEHKEDPPGPHIPAPAKPDR